MDGANAMQMVLSMSLTELEQQGKYYVIMKVTSLQGAQLGDDQCMDGANAMQMVLSMSLTKLEQQG
jgi:hypothetical protein